MQVEDAAEPPQNLEQKHTATDVIDTGDKKPEADQKDDEMNE